MVKKKKLPTQKQWDEIEKRFYMGETASSLGREFGVSETAIRKRYSSKKKQIKKAVNQIIEANETIDQLDMGSKIHAFDIASNLNNIRKNIIGGAGASSETYKALQMLAFKQVEKIGVAEHDNDGNQTMELDAKPLQMITKLSKISNLVAEVPVKLLQMNKVEQTTDKASSIDVLKELSKGLPE